MSDNRHPVDELFRLRAEKVALEARIDELRDLVLELPQREREGTEARATIIEQERGKIDLNRVRYEMGQKWIDDRSSKATITIVKVKPL